MFFRAVICALALGVATAFTAPTRSAWTMSTNDLYQGSVATQVCGVAILAAALL